VKSRGHVESQSDMVRKDGAMNVRPGDRGGRGPISRRSLLRSGAVASVTALGLAALAGCGEAQVVEVVKEVPVEKLVEVTKEVPVEKIVTQIVEKIVTVEAAAPKMRSVNLTGWTFAHLPRWHKANGDLFEAKTGVKTEWVGVSEIWDKLSVALQTVGVVIALRAARSSGVRGSLIRAGRSSRSASCPLGAPAPAGRRAPS